MNRRNRPIDILCVGEVLVDMMSTDYAADFSEVEKFQRFFGGSPANLAMNMARLGNETKLIATVGNDGMGSFLKQQLDAARVNTEHLGKVNLPTTLILVTRSKATSNFEAYRGADQYIVEKQLPEELLRQVSIFHTTCFGLSKPPAQKNIIEAAEKAAWNGCHLSIDLNYAQKIWSNRSEAQSIVEQYCGLGALVKVSDVDWERLYEMPLQDRSRAAEHFLSLGAKAVCVTMGKEGMLVQSQQETYHLAARAVEVQDTTGAGDAFWAGFLTAWLDAKSLEHCLLAARKTAELKISSANGLPADPERKAIYADFQSED